MFEHYAVLFFALLAALFSYKFYLVKNGNNSETNNRPNLAAPEATSLNLTILMDALYDDDHSIALLSGLLALTAYVARSDGHIHKKEIAAIKLHLGLDNYSSHSIDEVFSAVFHLDLDVSATCRVLRHRFPDLATRQRIMALMDEIAKADGLFHEKEKLAIDEIEKHLIR